MARKLGARDLLDLLAERHAKDVFVPELKNGPTHGATNLLKMDAWAMKRSWANPQVFGYEIKVSRSDFLKDDKWRGYLPLCTDFSFVTAQGVCTPDELPADVGLIVAAKTGTRLYTKRKAVTRDVVVPEYVYRYILMCRVPEISKNTYREQTNEEYWREWLERKEENRGLGYRVSRAIADEYNRMYRENKRLAAEHETSEDVRGLLRTIGITNVSRWISEHDIRDRLDVHMNGKQSQALRRAQRVMKKLSEELGQVLEGEVFGG